ncbi:MAG: protein phosphatase 2C domain-containing protein [Bradyrhizobium sp.]
MEHRISWIETGSATDVGRARQQNEDSFLVSTASGVWAVADGMGGHSAGDLASRTVVEELERIPAPSSAADLLANCEARIVEANSRLRSITNAHQGRIIGTTIAVLLVYEEFFACVWAGDSRIYRVRQSDIQQLSVDHTEVQELIAEGKLTAEEARSWPRRNVITRAIGTYDDPELEMTNGTLERGDIFVICSDGLTNHVEDWEIMAIANSNPPQRACDFLISLTLDRGATDNVTTVMVRFDNPALGRPHPIPTGNGE